MVPSLLDRIPPVLGHLSDEQLVELHDSVALRVTAVSHGLDQVGRSPAMDEQNRAYSDLLKRVQEEIAWRDRRVEVGRTVFVRATANPRLLLAYS